MNLSATANLPEGAGAIAAIDIGTNSVHLVVARMDTAGSLTILDSDKVAVRLGQAIGSDNSIHEDAIGRTVETIRHMKQIAAAYPCRIRAVATHATRVASNHERLLDSIKDATGIDVEVIDGVEEARLSFLGMRYGLALGNSLCLGVDVGGGSTELIVARGENVRFVISLNLGAVVLSKKFFKGKNPSKSDIRELEERISDTLSPLASAIKQFNVEKAVIASGTAKALAAIDHLKFSDKKSEELRDPNGYVLTSSNLGKIADKLEDLKEPSKIKDFTGLDQNRADIILAGTLVIKGLGKAFGIKEWTVSSYGLREGLIVDTQMRLNSWAKGDHKDVRWISVKDFCKRVQIDEEYAEHVAKLALQLYDGLVPKVFPKLDKEDRSTWRELLHAATMLHEAGKFLSFSRYHRHSAYIIANSSLMGFTQNEKMLMGLIARFHRKGIATNKTDDLENIPQRALARINFLAGILRFATALNRTRQNRVKSVAMNWKDNRIEFVIRHHGNEIPEVEMHMASREINILKKVFNLDVTIRLD